ncbi:MAG: flagellar basal body-associated protein FliL [Nitrospiria bacterium]
MAEEGIEEEDKESPKKRSRMKWILIGAVVILLLGGGGAFFLLKKPPKEEGVAVEVKAEAKKGGVEADAIIIYDLDPFIVNLADNPENRYLKVTINLDLIKPEYSKDVTDHLPQIRDSLLILLSSKTSSGIRTVEGKMELRDEILHRINAVFEEKKVKMAYFMDFVTQ